MPDSHNSSSDRLDSSTDSSETDADLAASDEGERLYRQFLQSRMTEIDNYDRVMTEMDMRRPVVGRTVLDNNLAALAEQFRESAGRDMVRQKAEEVDIASLDTNNFSAMLSELFHDGGVTQERILVLFFFCTDLVLRAVRTGFLRVVRSLTEWSVAFVRGAVSAWVNCMGGWGTVLTTGVGLAHQVAVIGLCVALIAVCVVYVKKNL